MGRGEGRRPWGLPLRAWSFKLCPLVLKGSELLLWHLASVGGSSGAMGSHWGRVQEGWGLVCMAAAHGGLGPQ